MKLLIALIITLCVQVFAQVHTPIQQASTSRITGDDRANFVGVDSENNLYCALRTNNNYLDYNSGNVSSQTLRTTQATNVSVHIRGRDASGASATENAVRISGTDSGTVRDVKVTSLGRIEIGLFDSASDRLQVNSDGSLNTEIEGFDPAAVKRKVRTSQLGNVNADGIYHATNNTIPSSTGLILSTNNSSPGLSNQTFTVTGTQGTVDNTKWNVNTAIHTSNGNIVTDDRPIFVANTLNVNHRGKVRYLLNGSSKNMVVNGLITPVVFSYSPPSSTTEYIKCIRVLIADTGNGGVFEFGNLNTALVNGLLIEVQSQGVLYQFDNLQDNGDILTTFSESSAYLSGGVLGGDNNFTGGRCFMHQLMIQNSTGDFIRATVRDNLIGLDALRMKVIIQENP